MSTKAYQGHRTALGTDASNGVTRDADAALPRIRAALVARGSSLRAWVRAWAQRTGRDPDATYVTARMTLYRRIGNGLAPKGEIGAALIADLRRDLGAEVVPVLAGESAPGGAPALQEGALQ